MYAVRDWGPCQEKVALPGGEELSLQSPWGTEPALELGSGVGEASSLPAVGWGCSWRREGQRKAVECRGGARMKPRRGAPGAR